MKKITFQHLLIMLFCLPTFLMAQQKSTDQAEKCLTDAYNSQLLETHPDMMGSESFETRLATTIAEREASGDANRRVVVTIPLVVHVLHNGEPLGTGANITDAQVLSQVTVMNEDFRRMAGTPGFNNHADGADVEVEFVMAKRTPDGCPTNGINRVNICQDGTNQSDVNFWKTQTIWNRNLYMNMWSSKYVGDLGGILGFAQFPGGPANTDGVSAGHTYFGSSDYDDGTFNTSPPYDKGRTMTHEVGHYLGLLHTFQGGCGGGDQVADTPAVDAPNFGCPTGHVSCGTTDMVENYMDYTDDTCMNIYTNGQKARVQAVLAGTRSGLGTSNGADPLPAVANDAEITIECLSTVPCTSDVNANIKIVNWGTATLTSATISYDVDGNGATNYNWNGSLAYGEYDTITLPTITASGGTQTLNASVVNTNGSADARACNNVDSKDFSASASFSTSEVRFHLVPDDYGSETTWTFNDESGVLFSGGPYTDDDSTPIDEVFTLTTTGCYTFTINDGFGDGICCDYGIGSYELRTDDDTLIYSGGQFSSVEVTYITVSSLSVDDFSLSNTIGIYPNPATSELHIKLSNGNDLPNTYKIYNMLGQLVSEKTITNEVDLIINTTSMSNGMYFIKINKDNNTLTLPFIKK